MKKESERERDIVRVRERMREDKRKRERKRESARVSKGTREESERVCMCESVMREYVYVCV